MPYLDKPNKKDREILRFCRSQEIEIPTPRIKNCVSAVMHVHELGNFNHAADAYEILVIGADRQLVKEIRKLTLKFLKEGRYRI